MRENVKRMNTKASGDVKVYFYVDRIENKYRVIVSNPGNIVILTRAETGRLATTLIEVSQ